MSNGSRHPAARWFSVDLHVHSAASRDVTEHQYGDTSPSALVEAAIGAGLSAIAVTDHNTGDGIQAVVDAASGTDLIVLPGVEISTIDGHLLAVFAEGTSPEVVNDLLTRVGIDSSRRGDLEVRASDGISVASQIVEFGGLAIPAHIDKPKGIGQLSDRGRTKLLLNSDVFAAFEIVDPSDASSYQNRVAAGRRLAFVQGSDSMGSGRGHRVSAVGNRRTEIKASRADFQGIRHALADPGLRTRYSESRPREPSSFISKVSIDRGFFADQEFDLSPDLTCLVSGTGTGKSLLIEAIRFVLGDQADPTNHPGIFEEVQSRLVRRLGDGTTVRIEVTVGDAHFVLQRTFSADRDTQTEAVGEGVPPEGPISAWFPIRAFSQGEVLEFSRQPFGRLEIIDRSLDLEEVTSAEKQALNDLKANSLELESLQASIAELEADIGGKADVDDEVKRLETFFDEEQVKQERLWAAREQDLPNPDEAHADIGQVLSPLSSLETAHLPQGTEPFVAILNDEIRDYEQQRLEIEKSIKSLNESITSKIRAFRDSWDGLRRVHQQKVLELVATLDPHGPSMEVMQRRLVEALGEQTRLATATGVLEGELRPEMERLRRERESFLTVLAESRAERRGARAKRIKELNASMEGSVKLGLTKESDDRHYLGQLDELFAGSGLHTSARESIKAKSGPIPLVNSFLEGDSAAVAEACGVPQGQVQKWFDHIRASNLVIDMLNLQGCEIGDTLQVKFKVPGTSEYQSIEHIAHGQKCTAVLILAMASGEEPLIVDQPEDALHAPWIEEHLVARLRDTRGSRQFIFATRSPGIVVSADAEMIITLEADEQSGRVGACGSLERVDLNQLALLHLEGGDGAFERRISKLRPSLSSAGPR